MTPVEKLEAAIKRLEDLRAASTRGPWEERSEGPGEPWYVVHDSEAVIPVGFKSWAEFEKGDAELIVTLHRTIEAQLAVLWHCRNNPAEGTPGLRWQTSDHPALALADAIIGGA